MKSPSEEWRGTRGQRFIGLCCTQQTEWSDWSYSEQMPVFNFLFWNTPQSSAKPITPMIQTKKPAPCVSELPKLRNHFCFRFHFDNCVQSFSLGEEVNPFAGCGHAGVLGPLGLPEIHTMMRVRRGKASVQNESSSSFRRFQIIKRRPKKKQKKKEKSSWNDGFAFLK